MNTFLVILAIALVGFLVLYFIFPTTLVDQTLGLMRRISRLKTKSIVVDGETWPYLEGGPESGEIVVLLHGFGGDKDNWTPYARFFTKSYRVISPDLPGFGENNKRPGLDYGAAAQAERLESFLQALQIKEKVHLAGNSMGGYIALAYALGHPERLRSLTLLNSAGVQGENKSELEIALNEGNNLLEMRSMEDFERLMDFVSHKHIPMPAVFKRVLLARALKNQDLQDGILWTINQEIQGNAMKEALDRISTPTLILWGRHDRLVDISVVEVLDALIPDSQAVVMEETGHVPMLERPKETAAHQIRFIQQIS